MLRRAILALAVLAVLPAASVAAPFTAYGPQIGFSQGPDQIVFGGHLQWGDVAPQLDFVPGIDFGFGDDETVVSLNGDFHYRISTNTQWQPYVGGGMGLHFRSFDNNGPTPDDSRTDAGGHFIAGAEVATKGRSLFFAELKLGFGDGPDFKVIAGWSFKTH